MDFPTLHIVLFQWKKPARCSPHLLTQNRTARDREGDCGKIRATTTKRRQCQKGATNPRVRPAASWSYTHLSHLCQKADKSLTPPNCVYVQKRGWEWGQAGEGGLALMPLIWFLRQWVIVEFLDISYFMHCVCVCVCAESQMVRERVWAVEY